MNTPNIPNLPTTPNLPTGQLWVAAKSELSTLEKYLLAFEKHERLLIVLAVLAFGTFGVSRFLNYESAQKDAKVAALTLVVNQDKQTVANLALSASTAQAAYQTTLDAITKQNVALEGSIAQMSANLAQRQKIDSQLPLPELGMRLEALVPAAQGGVTATTNGLALNATASYGVVNALEQVPVLTAQLKDETQVAANNAALLSDADKVIDADGAEIVGLHKSLADQQAHEIAAVAAEKLKAKKAWRNGFKWGFGCGLAAGAYIVHAL